jgi:hypothetical protein
LVIPTQNTTQSPPNQGDYDFIQDRIHLESLRVTQDLCHDFVNRVQSRTIQLFPPGRYQVEKGDLIMKVEIQRYNKQPLWESGFMDGLIALRMCLEDICIPILRRPPTIPELFSFLLSPNLARDFLTDENGQLVVSRPLSKEALWSVLSSYGAQFGEDYKLGIVSPTPTLVSYEIDVLEKASNNQQHKIVWIYNQGVHLGIDQWCAITPDGIEPEAKSFAQIVRQPGISVQPPHGGLTQNLASKPQVSGPPVPVNSTLLSINSSSVSRPLVTRHRRHSKAPSTASGTRSSHRVPTDSGKSCFTCQTCGESWDSKSSLT